MYLPDDIFSNVGFTPSSIAPWTLSAFWSRYENPNKIIDEIIKGFKSSKYEIFQDRKEAINETLTNLKNEQVLLILGKGIEEYQLYKENKIAHNDSKIVKSLIYNWDT